MWRLTTYTFDKIVCVGNTIKNHSFNAAREHGCKRVAENRAVRDSQVLQTRLPSIVWNGRVATSQLVHAVDDLKHVSGNGRRRHVVEDAVWTLFPAELSEAFQILIVEFESQIVTDRGYSLSLYCIESAVGCGVVALGTRGAEGDAARIESQDLVVSIAVQDSL